MGTREDIERYPLYAWCGRRIVEYHAEPLPMGYTAHHFIRTQWIRNNPDKYIQNNLDMLQKIIFVPTFGKNMHAEIHNNNRDFEKHWGVKRDDVLFNWEKFQEGYYTNV